MIRHSTGIAARRYQARRRHLDDLEAAADLEAERRAGALEDRYEAHR